MKINVKFIIEGTTEACVRTYDAINAGQAFWKCLKKYPQATLIKAWKEGGFKDGYGITSYQPPSMAKVEAEPEPKVEQLKFNFNEEVTKKSRRNSGKEWRRKKADRES